MSKCKQDNGVGTMKLFRVVTIVKEYSGCKNVVFNWFYADRRSSPRPYPELISDYNPSAPYIYYAEASISELFTEDEAAELATYLDRHHGNAGTTTIEEEKLPIPSNVMGCGAIPVGGLQDFYMLHKTPEYSLPFKVLGYFDLRHCERIQREPSPPGNDEISS